MPGRAPTILAGTDLVSVADVASAIDAHGERYLRRVYTEQELASCGGEAASLAARFAAKEACVKVLAANDEALDWRSIEVVRPAGRPALVLHGEAAALADSAGIEELAVSITHEAGIAAAVVVARCAPAARSGSERQAARSGA